MCWSLIVGSSLPQHGMHEVQADYFGFKTPEEQAVALALALCTYMYHTRACIIQAPVKMLDLKLVNATWQCLPWCATAHAHRTDRLHQKMNRWTDLSVSRPHTKLHTLLLTTAWRGKQPTANNLTELKSAYSVTNVQ
jgi:hypothetical protein